MFSRRSWIVNGALTLALLGCGCILRDPQITFDADLAHYHQLAQSTVYPQTQLTGRVDCWGAAEPQTIGNPSDPDAVRLMTLEEAIAIAISNAQVLRNFGPSILVAPPNVHAIYGPAIESSDPRRGMEAALSEFDATLATSLFWERNDRMLNNFFSAGGTRELQQDLALFQTELRKQSAAGTQLSLRNWITFDRNNALGNALPQSYDTVVETEVRQPLFQGAGAQFNRIAGPNAGVGTFNGVMVARLNTDSSLIDFHIALRDLVSNVENAYWDLYFAYRELDARLVARQGSLDVWQAVHGRVEAGQAGFEPEREAQFREQFYRFQEEVENALAGRLIDRTATFSGSSGGTFRAVGGVQVAERRLRLLLGMEINDRQLIRPVDEPTVSHVVFEWSAVLAEGLGRRAELRRQRLQVRRRELELVASRNFLLPRFDLVGRYRWRGLGRNLLGDFEGPESPPDDPEPLTPPFQRSSLANLFGGDYQEWQVGGELTFPLGFRRAHAGVRHAQLELARQRALLQEQERQVEHDLSNAVADLQRAHAISRTNQFRRRAAQEQLDRLRDRLLDPQLQVNLDQLIDAERRFADADVQYHRSLVEYMIAVKNVHFEKGSLLEYSRVYLAESDGDWGCLADARPTAPASSFEILDYVMSRPWPPDRTSNPDQLEPIGDEALQLESEAAARQPDAPAVSPASHEIPVNLPPQTRRLPPAP